MDPRQQPQLPFARNAASPFSRPSFPPVPASTQQPYPSTAPHAPSTNPAYSDLHSRKPSDPPPYYPASRAYPPDPGPGPGHLPPSTHSRHQSASSIPSGSAMNRGMPRSASPSLQHQHPQQQGQGQGPSSHSMGGPYGLPPPRPPPVSVGPPTAFPRGRELPALESLPRTGGSGSSMSISSMLGGPSPSRDQPPPPQYPGPPPGVSAPSYRESMHASPRMHSTAGPEYVAFRRPQTPERHRLYDSRDPRGPAAGSPQGFHSAPEVQRYGTPQAYPQRGPPLTAAEQAREQARMAGNTVPPRPSSQPKAFSNVAPPQRPMEMGRPPPTDMYARREDLRQSDEYNPERPIRVMKFEDQRYMSERERQERERQERDLQERDRQERDRQERDRQERDRQEREMEFRERERRERTMSGGDIGRVHPMHQQEYARQMEQRPPQFSRPPDPREQGIWPRPGYEQARAPYDPAAHLPRHQEYPPATAPHYNGHPPYAPVPIERHPPPLPSSHQHGIPPGQPLGQSYESPDRQRMNLMHLERQQQQQQQLQPRGREEPPVPPQPVAYGNPGAPAMFDSARLRTMEDMATPSGHQRTLLGVQEMNRKGRISPLPQAVQGAQPQLAGPAGEPGIKSEFGRMFSGIGTGVGTIPSPILPSGAQPPFAPTGLLRREDSDGAPPEASVDPSVKVKGELPARGKRRKLKEEEARNDDESTGRRTPVGGRAKKPKTHGHHHHQYVATPVGSSSANMFSHHHHHHHHNLEQTASPTVPGNTTFKNIKGSTPVPSPTSALARELPTTHHHAVPRNAPLSAHNAKPAAPPPPSPPPVVIEKPRQFVFSKEVLDKVADRPRIHLGDIVYDPILKPARLQDPRTGRPPRSGYSSTPRPLPWDLIEGKENCTLTVKIGKEHLTPAAREEITSRRALWGTDVYTDDSDVIAACIHAGWIRGEWPEDVAVNLLGLDEGFEVSDLAGLNGHGSAVSNGKGRAVSQPEEPDDVLTEPPADGPAIVKENRDLHVDLLILPTLEKYSSTTRFGIKSREFGGLLGDMEESGHQSGQRARHDGISFMITGLRWVINGGTSQNRLRGKVRRERIRKALREVELTPSWAGGPRNSSFHEDGTLEVAGQPGEASSAWWKQQPSKPPSEGDKENRPAREKSARPDGERNESDQAEAVKQNGATEKIEAEAQPQPPSELEKAAPKKDGETTEPPVEAQAAVVAEEAGAKEAAAVEG